MGEVINGAGKTVIKKVGADGAERGSTESKSSTDSRTATAGPGAGAGAGAENRGSKGTSEEKFSTMVTVEKTDEEKRLERNAKRRERYAKQKADNGQQVKPRKVKAGKTNTESIDNTQIAAIISTVSTLVASRPNMAHWQLTPQEIESLATPLSQIMEKSAALAQLGEHSEAIALVTACFTIFVPRIVISSSMKPKKENKKNVRKDFRTIAGKQQPTEVGKNTSDSGRSAVDSSPVHSTVGENQYFIGEPISY